jgi:glyoxylase-like metal-dependent hydrolase (beta-lactamase superfamily II)
MPRVNSGDRAPAGVVRVRASNPSPLTLDGTNTYVVEGWAVDPGPDDPEHLDSVLAVAGGGLAGIVLTHGHPDHDAGAPALARRAGGAPVVRPGDGERVGPFTTVATPGHAEDHVCLLFGRICFSGDTVLGEGSVFVGADGSSMSAYLDSLERLRALDLEVICPGHGPFVWDPRGRIDEYIAHRLDRERRVLEAIGAGARTRDELIDRAWSDVDFEPAPLLRFGAAATLEAHLAKLREEERLPEGFELVELGAARRAGAARWRASRSRATSRPCRRLP